MTRTTRKTVIWALAAAYGGIALLGHGLHWLAPEHGHHHGRELVQCAVHGSEHHDHHHHGDEHNGEQSQDNALSIAAGDCESHEHLCEICAFLAQARSEQPQLAPALVRPHLVAAIAARELPFYSPTLLRWHTPRGPPIAG